LDGIGAAELRRRALMYRVEARIVRTSITACASLNEQMQPALAAKMPSVRQYLAARISKFAPDQRSAKDVLADLKIWFAQWNALRSLAQFVELVSPALHHFPTRGQMRCVVVSPAIGVA
jgi:hypothetical protein